MVSAFKIGHRKPSPTRCGGRSNTVECIDSGAADTARATFRAQPTIGSTVACWPFEKPLSLRGGHNAGPLLPHVNMPAALFVASNAGCPRELVRRVVC